MREVSPELQAALDQRHTQVFNMAHLDFESGPVFPHNSVGDVEWDDRIWQGIGQMGSVSSSLEDMELKPDGITMTLNGLNPEWINLARTEHHRGRSAKTYIAARNLVDGSLDCLLYTSPSPRD